MSSSSKSRISLVVQSEQKRAANLPTALPNAVFLVNGQSVTNAEMVASYEHHIASEAQLVALREQLRAAVVAIRVERQAMVANDAAVKLVAAATLGASSAAYASLDFAAPRRAKPSVATKAEAIAKGAATREARHTAGPRQKAKIHGTVPEPAPAQTPTVVTK